MKFVNRSVDEDNLGRLDGSRVVSVETGRRPGVAKLSLGSDGTVIDISAVEGNFSAV